MKRSSTAFIILLVSLIAIGVWISCESFTRHFAKVGTYELDMQVRNKFYNHDIKKMDSKLSQWKMSIPEAYVESHFGINGRPSFDEDFRKENTFQINLGLVIDKDSMIITPRPKKGTGGGPGVIVLRIKNGRAIEELRDLEGCKTRSEIDVIMKRPKSSLSVCREDAYMCNMNMWIEGWPIRMSMEQSLLADPQPYCSAVKSFLETMTVHRDSYLAPLETER